MRSITRICLPGATLAAALMLFTAEAVAAPHRVYMHLMDAREHPDYDRHYVKPPTWETFGNRTQFTSLRGFGVENNQIVRFSEEIEKYTRTFELGDVLWPSYPIIFAENIGALAEEVKRRGLFLFDVWGYVPGSGPGDYWQQYHPPRAALETLEATLGERWLGMDVGEQDGRYIGGYASQMLPVSSDRFAQYLNFQRHFEYMGDELGNKLSALVSLNFAHHFLKEGTYTAIGAETAQALPNSQVYYAFIRGAGKQYGVPWFGNASIFNRWGYKTYGGEGPDHSPTKGTSLNLLKRLIYSHILYNCVFAGFESGWFDGEQLSPIGRIQQAAQRWVKAQGQPGVMQTPVAIMTDFFSGWTFPRHLYSGDLYRVWGNLPYGPGDYLMDHVLDMIYPGYQDASYFHDESGFLTPTPYGDCADVLLSDAPGWLLDRYPLLIIAGELAGGRELRDKLTAYAERGGCLVITGGSLAKLDGGLAGIQTAGVPAAAQGAVQNKETAINEDGPFDLYPLALPAEAEVLARSGETPAVVQRTLGRGRMLVFASPFGLPNIPNNSRPLESKEDAKLPKPYPLLNHVRLVLDGLLREQALFDAGDGLNIITCRKAPGSYTLGITNNSLQEKPLKIVSHCGEILSVTELPLDQSEKGAVGQFPAGFETATPGASGENTIAGGDVRLFAVSVREDGVEETPHATPAPRPRGIALPLQHPRSIKEEILSRPTFFEHFDRALVDWRYVQERDPDALRKEAGWLARQGLRIYVDLSSGINLYPDLRLVNNDPDNYAASRDVLDSLLEKMAIFGVHDVILCLHKVPENTFTPKQTVESFEVTLREMCAHAAANNVTVYLRNSVKFSMPLQGYADLVDRVAAPNLRLAASTALLPEHTPETAALAPKIGLWLAGASARDAAGRMWTTQEPFVRGNDATGFAAWFKDTPGVPVALDAVYGTQDEEYADWIALSRAMNPNK